MSKRNVGERYFVVLTGEYLTINSLEMPNSRTFSTLKDAVMFAQSIGVGSVTECECINRRNSEIVATYPVPSMGTA